MDNNDSASLLFNETYLSIEWLLAHWDSARKTSIHVLMKQGFAIAQKARYNLVYRAIYEQIEFKELCNEKKIKNSIAELAAEQWANIPEKKKQPKSFWHYFKFNASFKLFSSLEKNGKKEKCINEYVKSSDLNKTKFLELFCGSIAPSVTPLPFEWLTNFLGQLRQYDFIERVKHKENTKAHIHTEWKDIAYCLYLLGYQKRNLAKQLQPYTSAQGKLLHTDTPTSQKEEPEEGIIQQETVEETQSLPHLDEATVQEVAAYFTTPGTDIFADQRPYQTPTIEQVRAAICEVSIQLEHIAERIQ